MRDKKPELTTCGAQGAHSNQNKLRFKKEQNTITIRRCVFLKIIALSISADNPVAIANSSQNTNKVQTHKMPVMQARRKTHCE